MITFHAVISMFGCVSIITKFPWQSNRNAFWREHWSKLFFFKQEVQYCAKVIQIKYSKFQFLLYQINILFEQRMLFFAEFSSRGKNLWQKVSFWSIVFVISLWTVNRPPKVIKFVYHSCNEHEIFPNFSSPQDTVWEWLFILETKHKRQKNKTRIYSMLM